MQILSRLMIILALLGGLAYGSYAFGKYVLSTHLLNDSPVRAGTEEAVRRSTRAAEAVTRKTEYNGSRPKVDLKVLPAENDGEGPPPPSRSSLTRQTERSVSDEEAERAVERESQRAEAILRNAENDSSTQRDAAPNDTPNDTPNDSSDEPRRTRRARNDDSRSDSERSDSRSDARSDSRNNSRDDSSTSRDDRDSRVSRSDSRNDSRSDVRSSSREDNASDTSSPISGGGVYKSSSDPERPRKKRRKRKPATEATATKPSGGSMVPVPEAEPSRPHRATVITDSPVPRPESGGGDSPIPQPE